MNKISTRVVYRKKFVELGEKYKNMVVLDADLAKATKTSMFEEAYPEGFFDMGIAKQDLMGDCNWTSRFKKDCYTQALFCSFRYWPCF